jgi:hypothetical protein
LRGSVVAVWALLGALAGLDVGFALLPFEAVVLVSKALDFGAHSIDIGKRLLEEVRKQNNGLTCLRVLYAVKVCLVEQEVLR